MMVEKIVEIANIFARGMISASRKIIHLSDGWTIHDYGVELAANYIIANHAKSRLKKSSVFLEVPYSEILDDSDVREKRGAPGHLFGGSARADIAIYIEKKKSKEIIYAAEVKRRFATNIIIDDAIRLGKLLKKCGPSSGGNVAACFIVGIRETSSSTRKSKEQIKSEVLSDLRNRPEFSHFLLDIQSAGCKLREPIEYDSDETKLITGFQSFCVSIQPGT